MKLYRVDIQIRTDGIWYTPHQCNLSRFRKFADGFIAGLRLYDNDKPGIRLWEMIPDGKGEGNYHETLLQEWPRETAQLILNKH